MLRWPRPDLLTQFEPQEVDFDKLESARTQRREKLSRPYHAAQAQSALTASLQLDPANGHAWQRLAEALAAGDDLEGARRALQQSWALAPHTPDLALARIYLLEGLGEFETLTADEVAIATSDRGLLARHRPKSLVDLPEF